MRNVTPRVFLIGRPSVDIGGIVSYLEHVGGREWIDAKQDSWQHNEPELLSEFMGKLCYASWAPGINPNVTRVRTDPAAYFKNIISSHDGSVLEHAMFNFVFSDVSRVFTAELCRHRAGVAISEQSLRFVRLQDIAAWFPPELTEQDQVAIAAERLMEHIEEFQTFCAEQFDLDNPNTTFATKKVYTSAMRRLAPMGLATQMGWSANVRTLRWVIEARTHPAAETEIRKVFDQVAQIMVKEAPLLFADFTRSEDGAWVPEHRKV